MTRERLNELVRQSKSQAHLDYLLGRETAIEKISSGMADQYINHEGLVHNFGINWTRGFVEYFNAWRVINNA